MSLVTVQRSPESSQQAKKKDLLLSKNSHFLNNTCNSLPSQNWKKNDIKNQSMSSLTTLTYHEPKRCSVNFDDLKALYNTNKSSSSASSSSSSSNQNISKNFQRNTIPNVNKKNSKNFKNSPQNRLSLNLKTKSDYNFDSSDDLAPKITFLNCPNLTEKYFVVKDAALILPRRTKSQNTSLSDSNTSSTSNTSGTGDILIHLHSMISLLRPCDTIILAIKLSSYVQEKIRYLVIVETSTNKINESFDERVIIGLDLTPVNLDENTKIFTCSVGLILPIYANCEISLDGDGGFKFKSHHTTHIFKPVSIQAMWSAYQYLHKAFESARRSKYYPLSSSSSSSSASSPSFNSNEFMMNFLDEENHDMIRYYSNLINKNKHEQQFINEWYQKEERTSQREDFTTPYFDSLLLCKEHEEVGLRIKEKLREIMMSSKDDYGSMSSIYIREILEKELQLKLDNFKRFIDATIFQFYNQLVECATKILDYLYLGTEWNASNYDTLVNDRVTHILNVSSEVDNFFPDTFKYLNIRVLDVDETDLLKEFNRTYKFIQEAKEQNTCCLVHCKMGVSRSASVVIAYLMKEQDLTFQSAFNFTKQKRACINPNDGFRVQLKTYESILNAHKSKYNLFKPTTPLIDQEYKSENNFDGVSVKDAINKIKSLSSFDQLNTPLLVQPPISPKKNSATTSPSINRKFYSLSPGGCKENQIFDETPKLGKNDEICSVKKNESFVKRLANEFICNGDFPSESYDVNFSLSNENLLQDSVPLGTVKRQVESINIKSKPIEYSLVRQSTLDFDKLDQNFNQQQTTTSPDSKRFKCEFLLKGEEDCGAGADEDDEEVGVLTRQSEFNRSKKLFEQLELKRKEEIKETPSFNKTTSRHSKMNATIS
ncbi:unnamed protein product [Brachionus calyciflorus]|uniref:protein-serine/threonine phosphatase n=1 Tax=Brachionus calyciflorus TaxID=104777 RepID=A0A813VDK7_9BILA|nr:unnamed protein product [Brachionus calyciflorus]